MLFLFQLSIVLNIANNDFDCKLLSVWEKPFAKLREKLISSFAAHSRVIILLIIEMFDKRTIHVLLEFSI